MNLKFVQTDIYEFRAIFAGIYKLSYWKSFDKWICRLESFYDNSTETCKDEKECIEILEEMICNRLEEIKLVLEDI